MGLEVSFNIAIYALLTRILAHTISIKPGEFIHTLEISKREITNIEDFKIEDFILKDYNAIFSH
jgi:thymidylate synthase